VLLQVRDHRRSDIIMDVVGSNQVDYTIMLLFLVDLGFYTH